MNFISTLSLIILGITIIALAVWMLVSIIKNFQTGQGFRVPYAEKILKMRIGQMLIKHGTNPQEFLHSHQISDIEMQISNCSGCVKTSECDRVLNKPTVPETELAFCPNHTSITQIN